MRYFLILVFFLFNGSLFSQSWSQVVDFLGSQRDDATSFSIGDFGYVMTGTNSSFATTNDGYKYHAYTYIWYPMDTLPFATRQYSCAFSINGKGYLIGGTGIQYY